MDFQKSPEISDDYDNYHSQKHNSETKVVLNEDGFTSVSTFPQQSEEKLHYLKNMFLINDEEMDDDGVSKEMLEKYELKNNPERTKLFYDIIREFKGLLSPRLVASILHTKGFNDKESIDTAKKYSKFRDDYKTAELEKQFKKNEEALKDLKNVIQKNNTTPEAAEGFFETLKERIKEKQQIVQEFEPILRLKSFFFSPEVVDKKGRGVIYFQASRWRPNQVSHQTLMRGLDLCLEIVLKAREPENVLNGLIIVQDMKNVGLQNFDMEFNRILSEFLQNCSPMIPHKLILVNVSMFIRFLINIVVNFYSKDFRDRLVVLYSESELNNYIDKQFIPKEIFSNCGATYQLPEYNDWVMQMFGVPLKDEKYMEMEKQKEKEEKKKKTSSPKDESDISSKSKSPSSSSSQDVSPSTPKLQFIDENENNEDELEVEESPKEEENQENQDNLAEIEEWHEIVARKIFDIWKKDSTEK